ncbi:MAG: isoprenylcysteine carboxylmethyltransferase family protein [bacterium]|nr:isoprenylcysteine carboxylmethyltransferase family protein [bacterium]
MPLLAHEDLELDSRREGDRLDTLLQLPAGPSAIHFLQVEGTPVPFNPPPEVVDTGPYRYVRNPMVTGVFVLLFGLGFAFDSIALVCLFTPLYVLAHAWELKEIEEPELERRLGEEYIEYRNRTPMFIPRLGLPTISSTPFATRYRGSSYHSWHFFSIARIRDESSIGAIPVEPPVVIRTLGSRVEDCCLSECGRMKDPRMGVIHRDPAQRRIFQGSVKTETRSLGPGVGHPVEHLDRHTR